MPRIVTLILLWTLLGAAEAQDSQPGTEAEVEQELKQVPDGWSGTPPECLGPAFVDSLDSLTRQLAAHGPAAIPVLARVIHEPCFGYTALVALKALLRIRDARIVEPLLETYASPEMSRLEGSAIREVFKRGDVEQAIKGLGPSAFPAIKRALLSMDGAMRSAEWGLLTNFPPDEEVARAIIEGYHYDPPRQEG